LGDARFLYDVAAQQRDCREENEEVIL